MLNDQRWRIRCPRCTRMVFLRAWVLGVECHVCVQCGYVREAPRLAGKVRDHED